MESEVRAEMALSEAQIPSTPPKPPPLPAPTSSKERRKYSKKYGSGVYSESVRETLAIGSLPDTRSSYAIGYPSGVNDSYSSVPLGFGPSAVNTSKEVSGYGAVNPPPGNSAIERQENVARERAKREERAKQIGKMIHSLDSTQINEVLSMIMTPEQLESLKFYSETASKMRKPVEKKDWNKEFQKLLARPDDQLKFRKLYNLAHDFVYAASTYAKIIISELLLPESEKTIKPAALGGLAGGTKYVVQNIMFKFVLDFELKPGLWMYGSGDQRSDENAMKSASHELKGLMSYYSCNIRGLCFPLQALVDYKGFRVLAISILPINDETIIYGSSDAGKTVHSKSQDFNEKIDTAARILNLKSHYVNPTVQLSGPGDLEGHLGTDGKFYVLDAARTLPPEGPDENPEFREDRQVYYKLLRPEFVRKWTQPLCSDAFTSWQRYDPNRTENNLEVLKATRYLHEKLIPEFAKRLDKMASAGTTFADEGKHDTVSESFRLNRDSFAKKWAMIQDRRQVEKADINTTLINSNIVSAVNPKNMDSRLKRSAPPSSTPATAGGMVASSSSPTSNLGPRRNGRAVSISLHASTSQAPLSATFESKDAETSSKELDIILMNEEMHRIGLNLRHLGEVRAHVKSDPPRQRILIEMVARVIKDLLRAHLRHKMREVRVLSEEPFKEVVIKVFNFVLGRAPQSNSFWALVKSKLQRKYKAALSKKEKEDGDPMSLCSKMDMAVLFRRLEHLLGITLTESAREELESFPDSFEFVDSDVAEIYPKVKHMQIVDHAEGMALFLTAQKQNVGRRERLRQLRLACEKFARALTTLPDSFTTLYQWGLALIEEAHMTAAFGAVRLYLRSSEKFRSAVTINPQFQACFIKLGEAYIELARSAINAQQNGQPLHLPELDDWEDSFREEITTEFKTPPKSATKRYFIKATQAWDRGLALPDFFFEEVYQDILHLHSDAVSAREPNRARSRQLFYGSAILCEVVHNALNDHLLSLMNTSAAAAFASASATANTSSQSLGSASTHSSASQTAKHPSAPILSARGLQLTQGAHQTLDPASIPSNGNKLRSSSNPDGMLVSSDGIAGISAASVPAGLGTPGMTKPISFQTSPSQNSNLINAPALSASPSTSFVFSSGISVAIPVPVGGGASGPSHTPRIKDVISVITPALKTRLQSVPSQIMSSPYATGIGDEFAAMGSTPTKLPHSSPSSGIPLAAPTPITAHAVDPDSIHAFTLENPLSNTLSSQNTQNSSSESISSESGYHGYHGLSSSGNSSNFANTTQMPALHTSISLPNSPSHSHANFAKALQSAPSPPAQVPVSVGYVHHGVAVVKRTPSSTALPGNGDPEKIYIPASSWAPQSSSNPNVRPMAMPMNGFTLLHDSTHPTNSSLSSALETYSECSETSSTGTLDRSESPASIESSSPSIQGYEASSDQSIPSVLVNDVNTVNSAVSRPEDHPEMISKVLSTGLPSHTPNLPSHTPSQVGPISKSTPSSRRPSIPIPMLKIGNMANIQDDVANVSVAVTAPVAVGDIPVKVMTSPSSGLLTTSRSAGNLYHQGIVQHEALAVDGAEEAVITPRKMRVALDAAPTPFRKVDSGTALSIAGAGAGNASAGAGSLLERSSSPKPERPNAATSSPSSQIASSGAFNSNVVFLPPRASSPVAIPGSGLERERGGYLHSATSSALASSITSPTSSHIVNHLQTPSVLLSTKDQLTVPPQGSGAVLSPSTSRLVSPLTQGPHQTSTLRSVGLGVKHTKAEGLNTGSLPGTPANPSGGVSGATTASAAAVAQPKPTRTRMRHSASVSSASSAHHVLNPAGLGGAHPHLAGSGRFGTFVAQQHQHAGMGLGLGGLKPAPSMSPLKPSPSPQPSTSANGQYYGGVAQEDEIQQLLNLAQQQKGVNSASGSGEVGIVTSNLAFGSSLSGGPTEGLHRSPSAQYFNGTSGSSFDLSKHVEMPTFAVIAEAKFKPFLARSDSPPMPATRPTDKAEEHTYLKRILLDILAIWSDSLIQYASLKAAGDEMLFLAGAVKLRDVLALDSSYLEIIQTKIIPELKFQARDNRRIHYVLAALHGVIHEHDPTNTQVIYDMGDSLHTYAQLHRLNPAKLALHQNEAAECFEEALALDPSFADQTIHRALFAQGGALESLLSIVEYSKAIEYRTRELWDDRRVTSVSLAGCASVHDLTLVKLVSLCPKLKRLDVSKCIKLTDKGLAMISREVRSLEWLHLADCPGISDSGLQQFFLGQQDVGGCGLEMLNLKGGMAITDAAVTLISLHCPNLTHLDLDHCKITNNAAATLAQYPLPRLRYLSFAFCVKLEDSGLAEMVKTRRFALATLKLNGCNMLSDSGLETLVMGMPSITELHLASLYRISNASVSVALAHLKDLQILDIRNCKGLTWEIFSSLPFDATLRQLYAARMDPTGRPEDAQAQSARRASKLAGMKTLCANAAPSLQVLDIAESNLPEEPLWELACTISHRMAKLDLSGCPLVNDDIMSVLAPRIPHVIHLNLNGCYQLTSHGISVIAQNCRSIRELFLSKISENRESSLLELINSLSHLIKLDLSGNMHVNDLILADIASKLPQLEQLNVSATKISDRGLRLVSEHLPNMASISLSGCIGITNESLACIANFCQSLKELSVGRCSITDQGVISLAEGVPALRTLDLDNLSLITDVSLLHLVKHQDSMVELSIKFCTKITGECKSFIMKSYPGLKLKLDPTNTVFSKELAEASKTAHSLRTISSANIESAIRLSQQQQDASPTLSAELQSKFDRIKRPKSETMPMITQQSALHRQISPAPYDDPAIARYTLLQLASKDPVTANCNPECLELYLDDDEFRIAFGMQKTEFVGLISWRKKQAKESLRLF